METHILLITPGFPKDENETNTVTYLVNFIKHFKKEYPNILFTILSFHYPFEANTYLWNDIKVHAFGGFHLSKILKPSVWLKAYRVAKKIHAKQPITHVHSLWLKDTTLVGQFIAKKLKLKFICTAMGTEFQSPNKYLSSIDFNNLNLVTVSEMHGTAAIKYNKTVSPKIIPWGIPASHLEFDVQERNIDLLFVGYLNEIKNVELFIGIVEHINNILPNLKVSIVGDFFGGEKWRRIVEEKNLERTIEFHGILTNEATLKIMQKSKILVHTSSFEALGYAMLEAVASGMYVVSKQVGIATPSMHWKIAATKTDFEKNILTLLQNYKTLTPKNLYPIADTIAAYKNIYDGVS